MTGNSSGVRILVALEPRTYREAIGSVIRELRPHLEVMIVEPDAICSEVARLGPGIVLCSQRKPTSATGGLVWIEYRPYTEPKAIIRKGAQRWKVDVFEFAELLSVVDQAESLVHEDLYPEATDSEG